MCCLSHRRMQGLVVDSVPRTVSQQQHQDASLTIPKVNRLHETIVWGEDASNVAVTVIPTQNRVTLQIP